MATVIPVHPTAPLAQLHQPNPVSGVTLTPATGANYVVPTRAEPVRPNRQQPNPQSGIILVHPPGEHYVVPTRAIRRGSRGLRVRPA